MNKKGYRLIITVAILLFGNMATAQIYSNGRETKKADVNMMELNNYYKSHPFPLASGKLFNEVDKEKPKPPKPPASEVHLLKRQVSNNAQNNSHSAYLPVSPAPVDTFESTPSNLTAIPPDTHGAVDSQYCVTAINTEIHIQDRSGGNISSVGLDAFWASVLPAGTTAFDPRVHYDPFYKRWMIETDAVKQTTVGLIDSNYDSHLLVAVSATNDPTGTWHQYEIAIDTTNTTWLDFPNMGFNKKWIMVTGDIYPYSNPSFDTTENDAAFLFNYDSLMAGTGAPYTRIQTGSFSLTPATTYDTAEPNLYAIQNFNGLFGELELLKISGPVGAPVLDTVGYPATTLHWQSEITGGTYSDFAPQLGGLPGKDSVNTGDDRMTNLMYRNHTLWCAFTAFLPATGTVTRTSIMWWQIDTLANPIQIGLIDDPTNTNFYAFPCIAANANNDALLGFSAFSATTHPSAAYALHKASDPADSMEPLTVFRHGQAYYYETFGGGLNRWGDYSATCVDPRNDTDFWTIQEASLAGTAPNWDTWWASVQFCPKPVGPTLLSSPATLCVGAGGTYKINPIAGATTYVWSVTGTGWSSAASSVDSINVTIGNGAGAITVYAYNSCGEGESSTFHITPLAIPPKPAIATLSPACIGTATAVFTASATGASSFTWQTIGTGWSGSGSSSSLTATVGTGTALVICTATNACGTSTPDTLSVTPAVTPVSSFSLASHAIAVNVNDIITFTGTAPSGSTYSWNFGGGIATPGSGAGPQTEYWTTPGTKTVTLTVDNRGCSSQYYDTVNVGTVSGVVQLNTGNQDIIIMPNPNNGSFEILLNNTNNKNIAVFITDMHGSTVYSNDYGIVNNGKLQVSTSGLIPGNYTVSINIGGAVTTKKITVEH